MTLLNTDFNLNKITFEPVVFSGQKLLDIIIEKFLRNPGF
jgi:hypothetical protein